MQRLWVIRKQRYRETSALLTILLDNNRLVRCLAGAGKVSEFQPLFGQLLTTRKLSNLSKIEPVGPRLPLSGVDLGGALYVNEITHWIIPEDAEVRIYLIPTHSHQASVSRSDRGPASVREMVVGSGWILSSA